MQTANRPMSLVAWGMLIALSVLWGGSFIFNRWALDELEPFTVVAGRVILAAIALHVIVRVAGVSMPRDWTAWRPWLVMGIVNNVIPFSLILWGQTHIGSGLASILNATTPLFAVLIAHVATKDERLTANRLAGVLIGFAGVVVLIGKGAFEDFGGNVLAQLALLGASISYAVAGLWGRRLRANPPLANATGQVTCSALIMLVIAPLVDQPWEGGMIEGKTIGALLGLALLSTAIGYLLYFRILTTAGATNVLLVTLLIPVSALIMAAILLDEQIHAIDLAGMALIASGLLCIDGRVLTSAKRGADTYVGRGRRAPASTEGR
jgi:drug/metabolite transporter (DMT)-like permease